MGWHDAGTYDKNVKEWPQRGGANGSLRYEIELKHAANAGIITCIHHKNWPLVTIFLTIPCFGAFRSGKCFKPD